MLTVTAADVTDIPGIGALLDDLDRFYGAADIEPAASRAAQVTAALFGPVPAAYALLARDGESVVGLAAYSFLWPAAGTTRSLYLKELYVGQEHRRRGIGRLLMAMVREAAVDHGCSRVEWTADRDNPDAQAFYVGLGFTEYPGKIFFRAAL